MEAEIFSEIKQAEKESEETIESAGLERDKIIQNAKNRASNMLSSNIREIDEESSKKIQQFKNNVHVFRETRLSEGKESLKKLKQKTQKNIPSAQKLIVQKFYDMIK